MHDTSDPVIVEQSFEASLADVWQAITEADQMRQWFFENIPSFKPEVGFGTQFNVLSGGRNFLHVWELTEVIPLQKIVYHWSYEAYPGESFVTFALSEQEKQTKLQLTHEGIAGFPQDIPEFTRESCIGGWNYFIKDRLKDFLEKKQ